MRAMLRDDRLEAIAGPIGKTFSGPVSSSTPTDFSLAAGAPVTAYTVVDLLPSNPPGGSTYAFALLGSVFSDTTPDSHTTIRRNGDGSSTAYWIARRTGGVGPVSPTGRGVAFGSRVVIAWGIDGGALQHISVLGSARAVDTVTMVSAPDYFQTQNPAYYTHLTTHLFPVAHSEAVALSIQRWLMRRYGIPAPTS